MAEKAGYSQDDRAVTYWSHIVKAASAAHRKRNGGSQSISDFEAEAIAEAIYRDPLYGKRWTEDKASDV